ncbi:Choline dehydrogenase [Mycena sanguinolenta]|uniref:Choline dehydrogenase n=1 Tax=Mycena sanguinolenta TaxID=230812 RepID=A0A8H7CUH4_9AGAR|nr:Choline dehydrogenase [Mycena sanguinolenta]
MVSICFPSISVASPRSYLARGNPTCAFRFFWGLVLARHVSAALAPCANTSYTSSAEYDYIGTFVLERAFTSALKLTFRAVVGAGAGGGPLASRLAINGYKVLLMDAGHYVFNDNTTIPAYQARATEDPQITLDYEVAHYPPGGQANVTMWYPRGSALGGSTVMNALIHLRPQDYDLDKMASELSDSSWSSTSMRSYLTDKIENNLYIPEATGKPLSYGYGGWLSTDWPSLDFLLAPGNVDTQLLDLVTNVVTAVTPVKGDDYNGDPSNDGVEGGAAVILTKDSAHNRSSIRDHIVATQAAYPQQLFLQTDTMATKILTCAGSDGTPVAYGVEAASGQALLPVHRLFAGKPPGGLNTTTYTAKREVIVSAGTFQTPQLLMLSGIGPADQLSAFSIPVVKNASGVGANLQDRIEMTVIWELKDNFTVFEGCTFQDNPSDDPCLEEWIQDGHQNVYSSGPALWAHVYKSDETLEYLDVWSMWGPGAFRGYFKGYELLFEQEAGNHFNNVILKAHTSSKGWVRLTGADPQDLLDINKNQFQTAEDLQDLEAMVGAINKTRALWAEKARHEQPLGTDDDPNAVLDKDFKVRGVNNLRVVDASAFPWIPGMFMTTSIYQISEKAADAVMADAK